MLGKIAALTRTAFISGVSGQDGAYLARLLVDKGYRVIGGRRPTSSAAPMHLIELGIAGEVDCIAFDAFDHAGMVRALERIRPDEIYNFAAQSAVATSFNNWTETIQANAVGAANLLDCVHKTVPDARFYQASSSEMFGKLAEGMSAQSEAHPFHPRSPYGVSKLFAHCLTVNYRESYGAFAVSGILFNHESPLRSPQFVTRKITRSLAEIRHGKRDVLELGNIDVRRDWGFAGDYVEGIWRMLQQPTPEDYVLATGRSETVRTLVEIAAMRLGMAIEWDGTGLATRGIEQRSGRTIVRISDQLYRPSEIEECRGDARKATEKLGWSATTRLEETIGMMVEADERRLLDGRAA